MSQFKIYTLTEGPNGRPTNQTKYYSAVSRRIWQVAAVSVKQALYLAGNRVWRSGGFGAGIVAYRPDGGDSQWTFEDDTKSWDGRFSDGQKLDDTPQLRELVNGVQRTLDWQLLNNWEGSAEDLCGYLYESTGGNCDLDSKSLVKLLPKVSSSLKARGFEAAISCTAKQYFVNVTRLKPLAS